jgi:hypothetical protein
MGMFDRYKPALSLSCPACKAPLREWQGKDGPNGLFVWRQGHIAPIDQDASEDAKLEPEVMAKKRLPEEFQIYSYDCPDHGPIRARCETKEGIWISSKIESVGNKANNEGEPRGGV